MTNLPAATDRQPASVGSIDRSPTVPITELRVVGDNMVLRLDQTRTEYTLGTGLDVDLLLPRPYVSRHHATLVRVDERLEVHNVGQNGTRLDGRRIEEFSVRAGDTFEIGDAELLVMDPAMAALRSTLGRWLGFDAHRAVDKALKVAMRHMHAPITLTGPVGYAPAELAHAIHTATPRRLLPFVELNVHAPGEVVTLGAEQAFGGTVFVDLRPLDGRSASAALARALANTRARVILAASSATQAVDAFDADAPFLEIRTPPVKERRGEIVSLLDSYLAGCGGHRVAELEPSRVDALRTFDWPENYEQLHRAAVRIDALLEARGNVAEAAQRLGVSRQALDEALVRIGVIVRRRRGRS